MKKEVDAFTVEATTTNNDTGAEINPGELIFSSRFDLYCDTGGNDVDPCTKPREFNVLDDSSNRRIDICDYSNSTSISGHKRKHPVVSDDNGDETVYNASDITKKLNDPSYSSHITTNPKNINDLSFSSTQIATTSNVFNNKATVDLLSDSD